MTNGPSMWRAIECRLLDLKTIQNPLCFGHVPGRVGEIQVKSPFWAMSLHVEAPFVNNFNFLFSGFFL